MLHETLLGCINTGVRIMCKLAENFLILKILLKEKKGQEEWGTECYMLFVSVLQHF